MNQFGHPHRLTGFHIELPHIIEAVADPVSGFFHRPNDFLQLHDHVLPRLWENVRVEKPWLDIWHAGCSTGEDTYSLAMLLFEFASDNPDCDAQILATDFSRESLDAASLAVYSETCANRLSYEMKRRYLLRSRSRTESMVRIRPEIRNVVRFRRLDFMEDFNFRHEMDLVFCRNLIHLFHIPVQQRLLSRIRKHMSPWACLVLGHPLSWTDHHLEEFLPGFYFLKE
ncbi:MAG: chemotaxis protein CheR [Deltaproteobacteria bacterium]|nr:chemotaxis protein CheR [Deltaproteobacteria bacterium]